MARSLIDPPEEENDDIPSDVTLKQVADMVYALFCAFKELEAEVKEHNALHSTSKPSTYDAKGFVNGL